MPFGFTSTSSTFMRLMNHVLRSLIGRCVVLLCMYMVGSQGVQVDEEKVKAYPNGPSKNV
ncbi:hypothetical protein CR513_36675, partial [Mucuna pruriens]